MAPSDTQKDPRPPVASQLSTTLPGVRTFVTTHDEKTGASKIHSTREANWVSFDDNQFSMSPVYNFAFSPDLNGEKDVTESNGATGLSRAEGVVARHVDFAPSYTCPMHRTMSIDVGVVVEGTIEMILADGSTTLFRRGDVVVQRATLHQWRNPSSTEWARLVFVLAGVAQPLKVGGKELDEDFGTNKDEQKGSGTDRSHKL